MTLFLLYLWLKLDTFRDSIFCITTISLSALGLATFFSILNWSSTTTSEGPDAMTEALRIRNYWFRKAKIFGPIGIVAVVLGHAIPTQRQGAYLIAGYAGMKLVETPEMAKLTELVRLKVGNYLDEELKNAKADAVSAVASAVGK